MKKEISSEERIDEFISIAEKLRKKGIYVTNLPQTKTMNITIRDIADLEAVKECRVPLARLKQKITYRVETLLSDVLSDDFISELELDANYEFGKTIGRIRQGYYDLSDKQKEDLDQFGVLYSSETAIKKLIEVCTILKNKGIDFRWIQLTRTQNGDTRTTKLYDLLNPEEIEQDEDLAKMNVDGEYDIGLEIIMARTKCNPASKDKSTYSIDEDDTQKLIELGIYKPNKKTSIAMFTEVLGILTRVGIDVKTLRVPNEMNLIDLLKKYGKDENGAALSEEALENIIIELENIGISPEKYSFSRKKSEATRAYRGTNKGSPITEEEKGILKLYELVDKVDDKISEQSSLQEQLNDAKELYNRAKSVYDKTKKQSRNS